MFQMTIHGGEELAQRLNALPPALTRKVVIGALLAGAEPIRVRAERYFTRRGTAPHLAHNIVARAVTRVGSTAGGRWRATDEDEYAVAIGPTKDHFYGLFHEYGTVRHGATPFMRPAFDSGAPEALGIVGQRLWDALRKAAPVTTASPASVGWQETLPRAA